MKFSSSKKVHHLMTEKIFVGHEDCHAQSVL